MKFGEKVKHLRTQKEMSQPDLAKALHVSTRTIAAYESCKTYPRYLSLYEEMAKVLDTTVDYLRTENEEFMTEVGARYGQRGQAQAESILNQVQGLFAGGSLSDDDEIAFLHAIQGLYLDSKERAKKFTPKKYLKHEEPDNQ